MRTTSKPKMTRPTRLLKRIPMLPPPRRPKERAEKVTRTPTNPEKTTNPKS